MPIDKHLARRQVVQYRRVLIFISHDPVTKHDRTFYKKKAIIEINDYYNTANFRMKTIATKKCFT